MRSTHPRQRPRSPLKPSPWASLHPEVRRPVHRALVDAHLVGSDPVGEALLVVAGEVRRGGEPVEIVDVERVDARRRTAAATRRPTGGSSHAARASSMARTTPPSLAQSERRSGEERLGCARGARRGTSTSRRCDRPRTGTRRRCATRGSCRLRPSVACSHSAAHPSAPMQNCWSSLIWPLVASKNEPRTPRNPPRPEWSPAIGCGPRRWNTRSSVKIFARVSWSWSKIACVMRLTVLTLGWSLLIGPPESWPWLSRRPYEARRVRAHRANQRTSRHGDSVVLPIRAPARFSASPDAPMPAGFVRSHRSDHDKESPT